MSLSSMLGAVDYDYFVLLYLQVGKEVTDPEVLASNAHKFALKMLEFRKERQGTNGGTDPFDLSKLGLLNDYKT